LWACVAFREAEQRFLLLFLEKESLAARSVDKNVATRNVGVVMMIWYFYER
jgi:hypothetical protein